MITAIDVAWIAGLMEGEGSFMHRRNGDLVVQISMTDVDVIERVRSLFGFGVIDQRALPSGKTAYTWSVTNQRHAAGFMMTVLSFMGERRSAKIKECLDKWKAKPLAPALRTHCIHGHPLSGDNLRIVYEGKYEKRRCVECATLRMRKHRSK